MRKFYNTFCLFFLSLTFVSGQIFTENFGGYPNNASLPSSSNWQHDGVGDFKNKVNATFGAMGSTNFGQLPATGAAKAFVQIPLIGGNTYVFQAHIKTSNNRIYSTIKIRSGGINGTEVGTPSGNVTSNYSWQQLQSTYTPSSDEVGTFSIEKTQGQILNIDRVRIICTTCPENAKVYDFKDSKEGFISGGGCSVVLGDEAMAMKATNANPVTRSGGIASQNFAHSSDYNTARITFKASYGGAGFGKLFFYSNSAGNSQFATYNFTRDNSNTTTFQTSTIDLTANPLLGSFNDSIARIGIKGPWGINSGDTLHIQKVELLKVSTDYNVTFSVNTANITVGPNGMYAGGGFLGDAMALPLSDPDGDGTWEGTTTVPPSQSGTGHYIFLNSPTSGGDWGAKENLNGQPCGDPSNFDDRMFPVVNGDTTLLHCFGSCETDGTCPLPPVQSNVTFSVDMNTYAGSQTAPYTVNINGTFNGWCGTCNAMSDADGDGVWDVTLPLNAGDNIRYKFTVNGWSDQENFAGGEPCTNTNSSGFTDRVLTIPSTDSTVGTVCFNSCSACPPPATSQLVLQGVMDLFGSGNYSGTDGKAIHLVATADITDLSVYSLDVISNGVGSLNPNEYTLSGSATAGDHILIYRVGTATTSANFFQDYFGSCLSEFNQVIPSGTSWPSGNGDDPVALFFNSQLVDSLTYNGNPILSGAFSGDPYEDSWAYRLSDGTWQFGGEDCDQNDGTYQVSTSGCPYPLCPVPSYNDLLVGTWKLSPNPGSLGVGPNQGDIGWWSNNLADVTTRACLFDDSIHFDSSGVFTHFMDGSTWVENWQDGGGDRCASPVSPHDGLVSSSYHYDSSSNILTLNGVGAHIGIPKAVNGSELSSPANAPASITYILSFSNNNNTLTADIQSGGAWWRFVYDRTTLPPPASYAVTFSVNTANITVGPNGMYAGGGVLGDAMAVPLSDADGDGTWEGVATLNAGTSGNYIFLNSPSHGGDWGTKEDLTGLPCADPNNWNDRILPTITGDTTLLHCFGNCVTDGTCGAVVSGGCHYVIDMQDSYGDGWNGASITVSVNGSAVATWGLSSGSSGSDSLETLNGDLVDFSFTGGSWDSEITFQITDPSGAQIYNGGAPSAGSFLTQTSNATCVPATVNVTFQVDMGLVTSSFTTPEVNGSWNSWSAGTAMTDADGDGVWEATIALLSGTYEYKYAADGWAIQEMNDPTAPCTNGDPTYTNRTLSVGTSDINLSVVCWGSCDPCVYPPQAPVGITCSVGNPGVAFTDDIDPTTGWSGDIGTGNGIWRINSGGTFSSGTGPSGAHSGNDYLFFESSTGGLDTATAITPAIDLTAGTGDAELTFWMHAYGSGINTLDVGVSTSATGPFTNLYTWAGEYQQSNSDPWSQVGVNLASYVGQTVYVSFTYARGSAGISYRADIAIDYVQVTTCLQCVAPSALMASNVTTNSADVSWTAGGTETEWLMVVNGASSVVTSTTQALTGLTDNTDYNVQVAAICGAGDTSALSPAMMFTTLCGVATAPYLEDFDAGFSNCWSQDTADVFDWSVDANGTPSPGTGPSDDVTGGGNYMYTEASLPRAHSDSAIMMTGDIDISSLSNAELNFYTHMYGTAIGTLRVDMHDGTNYTTVFTKSGDQGDVWVEESVLLSTTASVVSFKVVAVLDTNSGGQAWPGDISVDNFGVIEAAANDLAIVAAVASTGCELTNAEPIEVWVVNQGLVSESNFDVSYSVNGGTSVTETIAGPLAPGDTSMYVFSATADMSADGVYDVDLSVTIANDSDPSNNNYSTSGENKYTPGAPSTMGDTICDGDTATVMAMSSDGPITWYDAMTGGNVVGSGDNLSVAPTATTSYYAEAKVAAGFSDDFESYNVGDFIAQSDTVNWATWPGGSLGGLYDAPVSNAQAASGSNSLHLDNSASNVPDPVLPFGGQTWTSGSFEFSTNLYVETTAYFNLQGSANIGTVWAMEMTFTGAGGLADPFTYDLGGGAITGAYPGTGVWFNVMLKCADLTTGTWELFIDGVSQGTATLPNGTAVGGCNLYAAAGNNYYVDDIGWSAVAADACTGARTEAVVTVVDCSNITELTKGNMEVYPNPNNGEFVITTSNEVMNVTITDVRGKVVYSNNSVNNQTINVNLSDLEKGMYMINVETTNGTMSENVIVQ